VQREKNQSVILWAAWLWLAGLLVGDFFYDHLFYFVCIALVVTLFFLLARLKRVISTPYLILLCFFMPWLQLGTHSYFNPKTQVSIGGMGDLIFQVEIKKNVFFDLSKDSQNTSVKILNIWDQSGKSKYEKYQQRKFLLKINTKALQWLSTSALLKGQEIRLKGKLKHPKGFANPGSLPAHKSYRRKNLQGFLNVTKGPMVFIDKKISFLTLVWKGTTNLRNYIQREIDHVLSPKNAELIKALLLGYRDHKHNSQREIFVKSGVAHVLAVSGLHVGILVFFSFSGICLLVRRFRFLNGYFAPEVYGLFLTGPILIMYALLCGLSPSIFRATHMVFFYLIAKALCRKVHARNVLGFVALTSMIINPSVIWTISWQLSFAAVLAIILGIQSISPIWPLKESDSEVSMKRLFLQYGLGLCWITLWATLGTLPLIVHHFGQVSTLSFLSNIKGINHFLLHKIYKKAPQENDQEPKITWNFGKINI